MQGVNFRYFTQQEALRNNVQGWVTNLPDGKVQGCFEGEEQDVMALVDWCRSGPAAARVDDVIIAKGAYGGEFTGFTIKR